MAGDSSKYQIGQVAYVKLVLHALKHKFSSVNGVLVGRVSQQVAPSDGNDGARDGHSRVEIVDAVPLFHGQLGLLPMLELALTQVDQHLQAQKGGLTVVGYYHANELFDDFELSPIARKIGDKIAQYCPEAVILLLDNKLLGSLPKKKSKKPVTQLFLRDAGKGWRQTGTGGVSGELQLKELTANGILLDYIAEGREQLVVDFDEHLDDISKDWLNPDLFN